MAKPIQNLFSSNGNQKSKSVHQKVLELFSSNDFYENNFAMKSK